MQEIRKTLLIHQVEWPIEKEHPAGKVYETEALEKNLSPIGGPVAKPYRTALYVNKDGVVPDLSVTEAIQGGTWNEQEADGITVVSHSDDFAGLMLVGNRYCIKNSMFKFITKGRGRNVNDFIGYGAVLGAYRNACLTVENTYLETVGVAKPSVFCFYESDVLLKDCISRVMGGTLYEGYVNNASPDKMIAPPWVLGITGNARGTNLTGANASMTAVNCTMLASQWGVMSTDMGSGMLLTAVDTDMFLLGESTTESDYNDPFSTRYGSGYGTYAMGTSTENFYGVHFKVGTYATIVAECDCTYQSSAGTVTVVSPSTGEVVYTGEGKGRVTEIDSDAFGIMAHGLGVIRLTDGTKVHTKDAALLAKTGGSTFIVEDGTEIYSENGVILQMIDNDDVLVGNQRVDGQKVFKTEYCEPEGWPSQNGSVTNQMDLPEPDDEPEETFEIPPMGGDDDLPMAPPPGANTDPYVHFIARNTTLTGNIYNGTGYYGIRAGKLTVELCDGAILNGGISATETIHVNEYGLQNTYFTSSEYYYLGHVLNRPYSHGDNTVEVTVKSGAVWNVTESGIVHRLVLEEGCTFKGRLACNGVDLEIQPGKNYTGVICVSPE